MNDPYSVIKTVRITEKGTGLAEKHNQYQLEVDRTANKIDIRRSVEKIFSVKVLRVNTINCGGKKKRLRQMQFGKTNDWKKAFVTLKEGDKIELA
ncbi:MAG: 50S ribosomal protein L23 [Verrucomicrobiae bacterium]|nr:50S ribosomal protein L23 [Verrucomicrobiae bacterium]